jgi:hypothetical protein
LGRLFCNRQLHGFHKRKAQTSNALQPGAMLAQVQGLGAAIKALKIVDAGFELLASLAEHEIPFGVSY